MAHVIRHVPDHKFIVCDKCGYRTQELVALKTHHYKMIAADSQVTQRQRRNQYTGSPLVSQRDEMLEGMRDSRSFNQQDQDRLNRGLDNPIFGQRFRYLVPSKMCRIDEGSRLLPSCMAL